MQTIEKSIEVEAPVRAVYNQWTQFEEFPRFMQGVQEVRQLDDKRLHWRAGVGNKTEEWYAEIFEQVPDRRIAWRSMAGAKNSGLVTFFPIDKKKTRVTLKLHFDPEGAVENVGAALGLVSRRVTGDLKRFKKFMETHPKETGGWRGEIRGKVVKSTGKEK